MMVTCNKAVVVFSLAAFALLPSAFASRPFTVDDAGIVEKNGFEVEVASNFWKNAFDGGIGIKHGVTDRMDIGAGFGYTALPESDAHYTPLEIGLKYAIVPELLSASFGASFNEAAYAVNLIASRQISFLSVHGNLGIEAESFTTNAMLTYGIATTFSAGRVTSGLEIAGTHKEINWWQIGGQVSIFDWLSFDLGIGGDFAKEPQLTATSGFWFGF